MLFFILKQRKTTKNWGYQEKYSRCNFSKYHDWFLIMMKIIFAFSNTFKSQHIDLHDPLSNRKPHIISIRAISWFPSQSDIFIHHCSHNHHYFQFPAISIVIIPLSLTRIMYWPIKKVYLFGNAFVVFVSPKLIIHSHLTYLPSIYFFP